MLLVRSCFYTLSTVLTSNDPPYLPFARVYDTAQHHFNGNFPAHLPIEQAHVHIGMFLGWMVEHHHISMYFLEESHAQIMGFLRREISCTVLSELWDGTLTNSQFSDQGNRFAQHYYGSGLYIRDFMGLLKLGSTPSMYHVTDNWANFEHISRKINERYYEWMAMQA